VGKTPGDALEIGKHAVTLFLVQAGNRGGKEMVIGHRALWVTETANVATSMGLAEHECERDDKQLITEVVVDVQDPAATIFDVARHAEGSRDTGRVFTRFCEVVYYGAAAIDQNLVPDRAVEIHVGHVQPLSNDALLSQPEYAPRMSLILSQHFRTSWELIWLVSRSLRFY